jgi:flagellar biosynthetic protein FlhB
MRRFISIDASRLEGTESMFSSLREAATLALSALLPIFAALIAVVVLAGVAVGGWNFSPAALAPDFTRMSPLAGLKKLFGLRGASELGKALLKCAVVGGAATGIVSWLFPQVLINPAPRSCGCAHRSPLSPPSTCRCSCFNSSGRCA